MNAQCAREAVYGIVPGMFQQFLVSDYLTLMAHQVFEDVEFFCGQREALTVEADYSRQWINAQVSTPEQQSACAYIPAQQGRTRATSSSKWKGFER